MKHQFKILVLMLITSAMAYGQVREIFKNSYDIKDLDYISLNLNGTYVEFSLSQDDNIHFDYTLEFENYSKKEIESKLNDIKTEAKIVDGVLEFSTNGSKVKSEVSYSFVTSYGLIYDLDFKNNGKKSKREFRKPKEYFIAMHSDSLGKSIEEFLKNASQIDEKGKKRKIKTRDVKILKTKFSIKIPKRMMLRVMAENSNLIFKDDIKNQLVVNARETKLKFKSIKNPFNVLDIVNGSFRANIVEGGTYKFTHLDEVQIAQVKDLSIDAEFSKIKIGEIAQNVRLVDFNSKLWLYNFSTDFGGLKVTSNYSEINLFYPESMDYFIETYGSNTVHYTAGIVTKIPPNRKNEQSKMMRIGDEKSHNKIIVQINNGIIRFGEDFIEFDK